MTIRLLLPLTISLLLSGLASAAPVQLKAKLMPNFARNWPIVPWLPKLTSST